MYIGQILRSGIIVRRGMFDLASLSLTIYNWIKFKPSGFVLPGLIRSWPVETNGGTYTVW
jgi:hypothetical protein